MTEIILQFLLSALAIIFAARWIDHACDEIAKWSGLGHFFVGSLFLAASTSAPEFFVDLKATARGLPNLAAGDLFGSSLINLIILASLTLIYRFRKSEEVPRSALLLSLLAALLTFEVGLYILFPSPGSFAGLHWGSYLLILTYFVGVRFAFKPVLSDSASQEPPKISRRKNLPFKSISRFALAALVLFFASSLLISSVETIALQTGLGSTFIGTTLLALTTSL